MKKNILYFFYFTAFIVVITFISSCKQDSEITEYYRVSITPPKTPLTTPSIKMHQAGFYESDETAIKKETELLHKLQKEYYNKAMSASPEQESFIMDMYKNVRDGQNYLLKITHKESKNLDELVNTIEDYGIESEETLDFCKLGKIKFVKYALEPLKIDDLRQTDNNNPLMGKYYCERSRDYYIIKPDGTGTFITSGTFVRFKWKQKGNIVTIVFEASDPVTLIFDEKANTLEESSKEAKEIFGTNLLFRKQ